MEKVSLPPSLVVDRYDLHCDLQRGCLICCHEVSCVGFEGFLCLDIVLSLLKFYKLLG